MDKLQKVNVDWKERFKNLYFDTDSKIKKFFRMDWTKKSVERKKQYNKKVDYAIKRAEEVSKRYNEVVDLLGDVTADYTNYFNLMLERLSILKKENNSVQNTLSSRLKDFKNLEKLVDDAIKGSNRFIKYKRSSTGTLKNGIDEYRNEISNLRTALNCERAAAIGAALAKKHAQASAARLHMRNIMENLETLYDKIDEEADKKVSDELNDVKAYKKENIGLINKYNSEIKRINAEITDIARKGHIYTKKVLKLFDKKANDYYNSICTFKRLGELSNKDNDCGEGLFRLISTKEKQIVKFIREIETVKKNIEEFYNMMSAFRDDIITISNSKEDDDAKNIVTKKVSEIKSKIKELSEHVETFVKTFEDKISKINIVVILPTKDKSGLLSDVDEYKGVLDKNKD